jgi:hypothetical protein
MYSAGPAAKTSVECALVFGSHSAPQIILHENGVAPRVEHSHWTVGADIQIGSTLESCRTCKGTSDGI